MQILVTGGLGFLGQAVTRELLAAGHSVRVLSRTLGRQGIPPGVDPVRADIRDRAAVTAALADIQAVVHLAGLTRSRDSFAEPLAYWDVNVAGTVNLLAALRPGAGLVFASTNAVYGTRTVGYLSEQAEPQPESPYADTKLACERMIRAHAQAAGIGAVTLRFFNIAGAVGGHTDTDPTRIIPNTFRALTGELPHVVLNGDGSAVRDFVHVADCAAAVRRAVEVAVGGEGHHVFNVGSGVGTSMAEVVACAGEVSGSPVPVLRAATKPEPHTLVADISAIRNHLAWKPSRSSLREIVADAWAAWQDETTSSRRAAER